MEEAQEIIQLPTIKITKRNMNAEMNQGEETILVSAENGEMCWRNYFLYRKLEEQGIEKYEKDVKKDLEKNGPKP